LIYHSDLANFSLPYPKERILQSYFLKTKSADDYLQTDKLAFLLHEIELACKRLKHHPDNLHGDRAILIFDDINRMDLTKPDSRIAVCSSFPF
jgi:hypothetical protein